MIRATPVIQTPRRNIPEEIVPPNITDVPEMEPGGFFAPYRMIDLKAVGWEPPRPKPPSLWQRIKSFYDTINGKRRWSHIGYVRWHLSDPSLLDRVAYAWRLCQMRSLTK